MKTSIYLPDELAEAVRAHGISISEVVQRALREEIRRMETLVKNPEKIVVDTAAGRQGFVGRWLVDPADDVRSSDPAADAGAYYGIAITARENYVVFAAHVNDRWEPVLKVYASLAEAGRDGIPADVIARAYQEILDPEGVITWLEA